MPRKNLIRSAEFYYHVTCRSNNREWFALPLEVVWQFAKISLHMAQKKYEVEISQFVLMNNHYHLLIKTPDQNIDKYMYEFNKNFSLRIREKSNRINKVFGSRYKWSLVKNDQYLWMVYKYIYQNPLRAKIVESCEEYPYSTLNLEVRQENHQFSFKFKSLLNDFITLKEINDTYSSEQQNEIKKGMMKTEFKPISSRTY